MSQYDPKVDFKINKYGPVIFAFPILSQYDPKFDECYLLFYVLSYMTLPNAGVMLNLVNVYLNFIGRV